MSVDGIERHRAIVLGSGVAGLSTALALGDCAVLTKTESLWGGSTAWAQGGIAVPIGAGDSPAQHAADTVAVSGGLADPEMVDILMADAPRCLHDLISIGARFDRDAEGELILGREAGHSTRRIVHANGDATGAELMRALIAAVEARADIDVIGSVNAIDLVRLGPGVSGVYAHHGDGSRLIHLAGAVVVATGGIGQLYARTTNPPEVSGDGIAMAARAGADLADMEFVQFHPTALDVPGSTIPLLTEAIRGEGAVLINDAGERFMRGIHPAAELAPRDVVARSIWEQRNSGAKVFLDATSAIGDSFPERFPTVFAAATENGLDPRVDPLPVTPAVHYFMGGVAVDDAGRTSLPGLWAAGEASSTGVHGANRLASNSLLEGLVFGDRAAASVNQHLTPVPDEAWLDLPAAGLSADQDDPGDLARIRRIMWDHAGIVRNAAGLTKALNELASLDDRTGPATRNMVTVGRLIAEAALRRNESRGGHYRSDHPRSRARAAARSVTHPVPAPTVGVAVTAVGHGHRRT